VGSADEELLLSSLLLSEAPSEELLSPELLLVLLSADELLLSLPQAAKAPAISAAAHKTAAVLFNPLIILIFLL
jgi:hypothetical protein